MTTIQGRAFAGLVVAHLALTVVVCGGFVLLLPAASSSRDLRTTISPMLDCSASADSSLDHQWTGGAAALIAPDSDDGDDDVPAGPGAAIAADDCRGTSRGDVVHAVHIADDRWMCRSAEGHSLRGPPADSQTSSEVDLDDGDDDPSAEYCVLPPPATSRATCTLTPAKFVTASSTRSSNLSLRAPPL